MGNAKFLKRLPMLVWESFLSLKFSFVGYMSFIGEVLNDCL